jgi:type II secretory ATPase GspE/PulE/Tfp pilus assembly ATPase PilB-like protein
MGIFKKKKADSAAKSSSAGAEVAAPPPIEFKVTACGKDEAQGVMISCRQLPGFPIIGGVIAHALTGRSEKVLMDYSANGVAVRFRVDGGWEGGAPMERAAGDAALVVLKRLCGLDPAQRKTRQVGRCAAKFRGNDWIVECMSQGVQTGERVLISFTPKKSPFTTLASLGMREKMQEQLRAALNESEAMTLVSGPPGQGLPTTWGVVLESADKFVRDFHAILLPDAIEPDVINVAYHEVSIETGETPTARLKKLLLKQPDAFVVPEFYDEDFCELILQQVKTEDRYAIVRTSGKDAVESLLTLAAKYRARAKDILKLTNVVLNQRLVRRLCMNCRQAFQPSPQLLQKLRIPPGRVQVLYQPFVPPPPEQRVDEKGNPIEIPICPKCNGRGYLGRMGVFELLVVTDEFRAEALRKPDIAALRKFAQQNGHRSFQEEGVLAVALGLTSLQEIQKMVQSK